MFGKLRQLFSAQERKARLEAKLKELREKMPAPVFWLYGKTQSGKTSLIKYLTGADEAVIGQGFKPCTRYSRCYHFPTDKAPLMTFLDTRGLAEASGYDPAEDIKEFNNMAHVVIVTVKVLDHALEKLVEPLRKIRKAKPSRPVLLVPTCLHEAYPQQQHLQPYPFNETDFDLTKTEAKPQPGAHEELARSLAVQRGCFARLADRMVPVDLTCPEEGFLEPQYGGDPLKRELLALLPSAYRQTLIDLGKARGDLVELFARESLPHILGYSTLAATAGAIPIPWIDLLIIPVIQTQMIYHLATLYGQPLDGTRFLELASTLGLGIMARQAARELLKFIPYVGSIADAAYAWASTFALGKAFCFYYSAVHKGHIPRPEDLRRYYREQLELAKQAWNKKQES